MTIIQKGEPMSDLISRQAALDVTTETVFVEYEDGDPHKEESIILQTKAAIRDRIKALPPVQPEISASGEDELNVPEMNVGDMIYRQAAIDAIHEDADWLAAQGSDWQVERMERDKSILKSLPTVQPTIIHCKDCKRFRKPSSIVNADWGWCSGWPTPLTTFVKVDGFCHRAEKRGEAE